jgi:hypothetical protein
MSVWQRIHRKKTLILFVHFRIALNAQPALTSTREYDDRRAPRQAGSSSRAEERFEIRRTPALWRHPWVQPFESRRGIRWQYEKSAGVYFPVESFPEHGRVELEALKTSQWGARDCVL